jgi:hypothetical protein
MTNFTLRPMAPDDAATVAALIRAAFAAQSIATDPPPSALRVTEPEIAAHLQNGGRAVAEVGRTLVGSAPGSRSGTIGGCSPHAASSRPRARHTRAMPNRPS